MDKKVSIIMVNYKTVNHALECLESISKQTYNNIKTVIVDNNSNDNCKMILESRFDCKVILNDDNLGFSAANNIGINYCWDESDYFMLLNCDTTLEEHYIEKLMLAIEKTSNIGIISGKILQYYDKEKIWYNGGNISNLKGSNIVWDFDKKNYETSLILNCSFVSGCCMLIPKEVLINVGFMSEDYFLYYEDTDYCKKIINKNYKLYVVTNAVMYHKESVSTDKKSRLYTYYFVRNRFIFIKNNYNFFARIIPYIYSYLWVIKKVLTKKFFFKESFLGHLAFLKGERGKSNRF